MTLVITDASKFTVEVDKDNNEIGLGTDIPLRIDISAESWNDLLVEIERYFGIDSSDIHPVPDRPTYIEFAVYEDRNGLNLTEREYEQFQAGKKRAWISDYNMQVCSLEPLTIPADLLQE